jgi:hypothetical protein
MTDEIEVQEEVVETAVDAAEEEVANPQTDDNEVLEEGENDPEPAKQEQDPKINAKFAEMRRKVEEAERKERERDAWVERNYGSQGIKTWDEYQTAIERDKERAYYEERGLDPDVVDEAINKKLESHPSILAARQREHEAFQASQMAKLNKTYGLDVKSLDDIKDLPNADAMIQKIMSGYEWDEAYLVTHQEHIAQNLASKAKQSAINNQQSKAHMKLSKGGGDVDTFTPDPGEVEVFRKMFSKELRSGKMKEADIIAHLKKSKGK